MITLNDGRLLLPHAPFTAENDPHTYVFESGANPVHGQWVQVGPTYQDRVTSEAVKLKGGRVLTVGGFEMFPDKNAYGASRAIEKYKCPDDGDVTVLGETVTMTACWAACRAQGGAGCWCLDGAGGFARECRVCNTLQPVEMSWPNDWARNL